MIPQQERDALVKKYIEYARALVNDLRRGLPHFLRGEDLEAVALAGLVEAATRFDPSRGAQFKTFAYYRVRGAVFDHLRRTSQLNEAYRARLSAVQAVDEMMQSQQGDRPVTVGEAPADAAKQLFDAIDSATVAFTLGECAAALHSRSAEFSDPSERVARLEEARALELVLDQLPEKERAMLRAVYVDGRTIEQAGQTLGLSKSWASRLHARALQLARDAMTAKL
jgi:RNA polymerase sigma factor for flagellar operon FliA